MANVDNEMWENTEGLQREFSLWMENTEPIYGMVEWCVLAMAKKWARGEELLREHLNGTSTVSKIVTETMKKVGGRITSEQRKVLKDDVADEIWYRFEEEIGCNEEYAQKREKALAKKNK